MRRVGVVLRSRVAALCASSCALRSVGTDVQAQAMPQGTVRLEVTVDNTKKLEELAEAYSQLTLREIVQLQKLVFKKLGHSDAFYEQALLRGLGGGGGGGGASQAPQVEAPPANGTAASPPKPADASQKAPNEAAKPASGAPPPSGSPAAGGGAKKPAQDKMSFDVKLAKFTDTIRIKLIKELRTVTNLPLKEAKDAIDKCPGLAAKNLGKEDAEKLKKAFEALGAEVELL